MPNNIFLTNYPAARLEYLKLSVISNYAFSECDMKLQKFYYDKIIANAKCFYMVYNNIVPYNMNSNKFKEYCSKDFDLFVEEEIRPTHTNYIFYGRKKEKK